ncbi:sensor histidine kinase [Ensifer adhaerens]|uniref:sensor histidine kinase n=1 Tax=Ensifer adhaerens TaxID=106592 RepID=UPI001CBE1F9A|nr:sensor histidine kinase [Ensifer adhaerens]MBZ7923958.1 sensor histidine kinase [Ensifer adhaerens]UAX92493.1 sensor histidine kinase [Ensifer adhaerens]UAY00128.1 sensor histidine kinase [Ensifer adhaerens]UAY07511.1 sensor histidine kinase [Ensifer adhaerens]
MAVAPPLAARAEGGCAVGAAGRRATEVTGVLDEGKRKAANGLAAVSDLVRHRLTRPFSFYLTSLLLVAIVPAFIFSLVVLKRSVDQQEQVITALLQASTGSVTRIVERDIEGMLTTLKVLSTSQEIEDGNMEAFYGRAATALAGTDSYLIVIDRNHNQRLNTRVPFGAQLSKASDPDSVERAFTNNDAPLVSNVFFGQTAGKWVFNVYLPAKLSTGEEYLLTLTQNAENMAKAVNRDTLSPGWSAALVDGAGKVIISSDAKVKAGEPFFLDKVPAISIGVRNIKENGTEYRVATEFSVVTGWRIIAWAPRATVDAPAVWSFLWLSLGGIIFAGIAIAGSLAIARLLSQGVKLVAQDARRLGAGERIESRPHMIAEVEQVSAALARAAAARGKAENEIRFLMREVAHRSKNQLTVIQSMLNQSVYSAESASDFADSFRKRIAGLARSTDLMIANAAQGVDFRELAQNQLQPFTPDDPTRVILSGPALRLDTQISQTLGMALHELATNATKYGALANTTGVVKLSWSLEDEGIAIRWREEGADLAGKPSDPVRKGFGTLVLERMLGMALNATLERVMHADGIEWRITIPRDAKEEGS